MKRSHLPIIFVVGVALIANLLLLMGIYADWSIGPPEAGVKLASAPSGPASNAEDLRGQWYGEEAIQHERYRQFLILDFYSPGRFRGQASPLNLDKFNNGDPFPYVHNWVGSPINEYTYQVKAPGELTVRLESSILDDGERGILDLMTPEQAVPRAFKYRLENGVLHLTTNYGTPRQREYVLKKIEK